MATDLFCLASNDEDFGSLVECTRRPGHDEHHCDSRKRIGWDADGEVECFAGFGGYDHGQPPNRATRRGNVTHESRQARRISGKGARPSGSRLPAPR